MFSGAAQKVSAFFSHFLDRYKPAILTLLLLAGGFYFYFNVIVSGNEDNLKERSFRGLHRVAANISKKIADYREQNAANFLAAVNESRNNRAFAADSVRLSTDAGLQLWYPKPGEADTPKAVGFRDGWKLFFSDTGRSIVFAPVDAFVSPFLRRDLFTHYFFAYGDTVLFDELNISNRNRTDFLLDKSSPDSSRNGGAIAGDIQTLNIGGRDYKLFLLPFTAGSNRSYTLGGYMPLDRYVSEQRYIPTYALIWMVIGLLLVLLMFPLLKIFLMQRAEQLTARNAIASMAALHVVGAMAVLIALNVYVYFTFVTPAANKTLRMLATDTGSMFLAELDACLEEMQKVEASTPFAEFDRADRKFSLASVSAAHTKWQSVKERTVFGTAALRERPLVRYVDSLYTARLLTTPPFVYRYRPGSVYPYFRHLAWANDSGRQVVRWTTQANLPQKINVADRDYFDAVKSGSLWRRNGQSFYLTAISSWVSQERLMVVSKRSAFAENTNGKEQYRMMNLSSPFRSLFKAVLPEGYGFCLVKPNGDVLFHMDQNRSLNENLLEECNQNGTLQALLQTRSEGSAGTRYAGTDQRVYVVPLAGLPLSVVAFRDMRLIWSEDLDVISTCSILCLMNLAVILLAILIVQISGYRHSLLQNQSILFTWLRPNKDLAPAYQSVSAFFVTAIILQMFFFFLYPGVNRLCLVGVAFSYSYILLSYMYYRFAITNQPNEFERQRNKKPMKLLAVFYLFTTLVFSLTLGADAWAFLLSQALLLVMAWRFPFTDLVDDVLRIKRNFRWWYVSSLFSFVAATAITPILIFYCLSFKEERLLSVKHTQLAFANRLAQPQTDSMETGPLLLDSAQPYRYDAPFHFKNFASRVAGSDEPGTTGLENRPDGFEQLYKAIKPAFSSHSREIEYLIRSHVPSGYDFQWLHNADSNDLRFQYRIPYAASVVGAPALAMQSRMGLTVKDTGLTIWKAWQNSLLLVAALLLLLVGFEFLLKRLVQRIFFEGFQEVPSEAKTDLPYVGFLPSDENIYIVGPVNSGKHQSIRKMLEKQPLNVVETDLATLTNKDTDAVTKDIAEKKAALTDASKRCLILLRHFEIGMNDAAVSERKLKLLETLLQEKQQIVVLSSRSLDTMSATQSADGKDLTERWSSAINQFYTLYHRWQPPADDPEKIVFRALRKDLKRSGWEKIKPELEKITDPATRKKRSRQMLRFYLRQVNEFMDNVNNECRQSDFLWSLRPTLFNYLQKHKGICLGFYFQNNRVQNMRRVVSRHFTTQFEQVCLKIQSLATNYYLALWQSLSADEKRTLLDIGTDDMVNPANRLFATRLANLGLIKPEPHIACYQLMNRSFRNFVFTQVDKGEIKALKAGEKGSWNSFELPVLTVVVALGIFLFTTQKDAFTSLLTYLGAAAGGIAALLKLLGMIPSNKN